jgi:NAD(P)-dependent dehydrogenase (short-subunit alcohol dehydrogenase family)
LSHSVELQIREEFVSLSERTTLITGAGRGIGEGIATVLAERGARVAVNDLHPERAATVAHAIASRGGRALAVPFDVTDARAVHRGVAMVERELGAIDILVNNAGIPEGRWTGRFIDSSPEAWTPYIELNIYGAMRCVHTVISGMCERGWGRIIQISSASASRALAAHGGESIYSATKATMEALLRHVAVEVARDGVTCNAVAPGVMEAALANADPAVVEGVVAAVPAGRLGRAREIGEAVAWLASDGAGFVTGQVIHVNGGAFQGR